MEYVGFNLKKVIFVIETVFIAHFLLIYLFIIFFLEFYFLFWLMGLVSKNSIQ